MLSLKTVFPSLLWGIFLPAGLMHAEKPVSYNFQVKPILAEHCLKCHGQDEKQRKAKLRLDDRENAISLKSVIPGKPEESELIKRLLTTDQDEVMPPPKEHRAVSAAHIALLRQWIAEGAPYERHWSFIPPVKPEPPVLKNPSTTPLHPIDAFVLARLEKEKITPAPPAKREDWLRRVTFDLTGLPPTLEELDAFLADVSPNAFESVADRLLTSKTYGERMAADWLDVARYADTYGRHEDHDCHTWPYRDWVVRMFNDNLPFDKFVIWQTAGDMLPDASLDMHLATVFNRLPQQSNEAGSNEEEFRQEIIADRVRTNGMAFLGLSLECARCHDHKYDPISMRDYYSMAAFLNNIDESGLYTVYTKSIPAPSMFIYADKKEEERHTGLKSQIASKERERNELLPEARARFQEWLKKPRETFVPAKPIVEFAFDEIGKDKQQLTNRADAGKPGAVRLKTQLSQGRAGKGLHFRTDNSVSIDGTGEFSRTRPFSLAIWLKPERQSDRAVVIHHSRAGLDAGSRGYELLLEDGRPSFALCHFWPGNAMRIRAVDSLPLNEWTHIVATYDGSSRAAGMKLYVNGLPAAASVVRDNLYKDVTYDSAYTDKDKVESAMLGLAGRFNDRSLCNTTLDDFLVYDVELSPLEVRLATGVKTDSPLSESFEWWLREKDELWKKHTAELRALREDENQLSMKMQEIMVMREMPAEHHRETHVLARGRYDSPAEVVSPRTPESVFAFPADLPKNRVGLAQWLVDRRNPLTARVYVNRMWQMFFGRGIVPTSEDFGIQGQLPSNPELLDWLAVDFMDKGWDVKALCRQIVLSQTYRQSSMPGNPDLLVSDPDNDLLARGPRQRLTAEQLRDNALAVSGLLDRRFSGKPVMPYQPAGLWEDSGTQHTYLQSKGADLWRRSLYSFWRRTLPPPSMTIFDAPTREFCKSRRDRSATPLQALVLFNDTQFIESARVLAENLVREFPSDDTARSRKAFRLLTSQNPSDNQTQVLTRLIHDERERFRSSPVDVENLRRKNGEAPVDEKLDAVEVAATTMLTRALLGYDECVMKP